LTFRPAGTTRPVIHVLTACAKVDDALRQRLVGADMVFFDGTLWTDDEMIAQGLASKTGQSMGHIAMSGPQESIAALEALGINRKVFVHINNSNPALLPGTDERQAATAAGWIIAHAFEVFVP
jgi:pyrroloquinoline quinone biosynthesis protein B